MAGFLAYVAFNMVKWHEVKSVHAMNRFHIFLMYYTAAVVLVKDFLTGVLSAIVIYVVLYRFFDTRREVPEEVAGEPRPRAKALAEESVA